MFTESINNIPLQFNISPKLFSPGRVDGGTLAMLKHAAFASADKVLDLGCGYGAVGIAAAKTVGPANVVMCDIDPVAVRYARENAELNDVAGIKIIESDGFKSLDETGFTVILSNPPYHTDFSVAKHFIEKGFNRLIVGGRFLMVTKRRDWYKNKITAIFGGVKLFVEEDYFVFLAEKRGMRYANAKQ
jgi:16S rRNA (guanine1207-N2)-methyltransferase